MPSSARASSLVRSNETPSKKFKNVLGFNQTTKYDPTSSTASSRTVRGSRSFARKNGGRDQKDASNSDYSNRKRRLGRSSIPDFNFEREAVFVDDDIIPDPRAQVMPPPHMSLMVKNHDSPLSIRRPPVRIGGEDGPWTISVAETPHDTRSYTLYIKTPTHNLTLTRTAMEIVELDEKLRDNFPNVTIPAFPLDATAIAAAAPKRKSTFLNTLSRLTSPTSNKTSRQSSTLRRSSNAVSNGGSPAPPTVAGSPVVSPTTEQSDPFQSFTSSNIESSAPAPSAQSTALAAYLTTISNTSSLRQARVWKRFVRVRTDDLESVRVERALKRVHSDLAAHGHGGLVGKGDTSDKENVGIDGPDGDAQLDEIDEKFNGHAVHEALDDSLIPPKEADEEGIKGDYKLDALTEDAITAQDDTAAAPTADSELPSTADVKSTDVIAEEAQDEPRTPPATHAGTLTSQSSASDFGAREGGPGSATPSSTAEGSTMSQSETGDESSAASATGGTRRKRKKQAMSIDPSRDVVLGRKKSQRKVGIDDFEMMRVLGKGCAGKVLLVRHKASTELYALKAITKRHVLAHQELQHTLTEQSVLKRMAAEGKDPFVVKLWWSFHDKENLFLVMDFHPGGDLATQLARWGRLGRDRARFYAAEIVEGVEGLHAAGVIYRDLKPENILIGGDGHIVLTDFGLSKEFPHRRAPITAPPTPSGTRSNDYYSSGQPVTPPWMKATPGGLTNGWPGQPAGQIDSTTTFCGTAEYLAPEVIQGLPYSYEVDWWSFGTMLYEMLTGITPFWAKEHSEMYIRVLQDELQFPDDRAMDQDTKSLIRGLLQRNPGLRICEPRIKRHPYFSMIDWSHVYYKRYIPPYIPPIDPSNASDTQNFDDTFLDMEPVLDSADDVEQMDTDQDHTDTDPTDGEEMNTTPSQSRSPSMSRKAEKQDDSVDVFDGYSFKGRHSVLLDDEEEEMSEEEVTDDEVAEDVKRRSGLEPDTPKPHELAPEEDEEEPKTPEARPAVLPPESAADEIVEEFRETTPIVNGHDIAEARKSLTLAEAAAPQVPEKDLKPKLPPKQLTKSKLIRARREKSGVAALDRYLSDAADDMDATELEEDDWAFIEAGGEEDRNGARGTTLFARGVVDKYRLAVFRKASTPSAARSVSGMSKDSEATLSEVDSPSPSRRRGRNPGLTFRRHPRQFLKNKTPPSSYSSRSSAVTKTNSQSNSTTLSAASSGSAGLLAPSQSSADPMSPSLRSKESATSFGAQSSSDQSAGDATDGKHLDEQEKPTKNKKLVKKYKEGAEKVLSIFSGSTPRQQAT